MKRHLHMHTTFVFIIATISLCVSETTFAKGGRSGGFRSSSYSRGSSLGGSSFSRSSSLPSRGSTTLARPTTSVLPATKPLNAVSQDQTSVPNKTHAIPIKSTPGTTPPSASTATAHPAPFGYNYPIYIPVGSSHSHHSAIERSQQIASPTIAPQTTWQSLLTDRNLAIASVATITTFTTLATIAAVCTYKYAQAQLLKKAALALAPAVIVQDTANVMALDGLTVDQLHTTTKTETYSDYISSMVASCMKHFKS